MPYKELSTPSLYAASETASPLLSYSPSFSAMDGQDWHVPSIYGSTMTDPSSIAFYAGLPYVDSQPPKLSLSIPDGTFADLQNVYPMSAAEPAGISSLQYLASAVSPEPDSFLPIQRPDLPVERGSSSTYPEAPSSPSSSSSSLDDDDEDDDDDDDDDVDSDDEGGEELVGMGLYDDTPPSLGYARRNANGSSMDGVQRAARNVTGKGLKLEERWEPPEEDTDCDDELRRGSNASESVVSENLSSHTTSNVPNLSAAGSFLLDDGDWSLWTPAASIGDIYNFSNVPYNAATNPVPMSGYPF